MRFIAVILMLLLCGCSAAQLRQEFIGYSINDVKNSKNKQVLNFDMIADDCIMKIKDVLNDMGAIIRENRRKKYIVADSFEGVFRSTIDTTQVGILVIPTSEDKCRVEVASGNIALAEFVAREIAIKDRPKKGMIFKKQEYPI